MPPTTGGSTIGSVVSPRSNGLPGNRPRASSQASGKPKASASAVVATEATSESQSASSEDELVITLVMLLHGARITSPVSGSMKNSAAMTARPTTTGLPSCRLDSTLLPGRDEAVADQHLLPGRAEHVVHEGGRRLRGRRLLELHDRVLRGDVVVSRDRHAGDLVACGGLDVGDVDDPSVGLAERDLGHDRADAGLLADRVHGDA